MPTKTDRILALLPGTFQAASLLSALRAVVDAPGRELLLAENSLAAVMRAHWVDHADRGAADRGAREIDDLARFAALWGLAPRPDEGVEAFREHLKRTVRTFLDGTVTVEGLLRVAAENLGLEIAEPIDAWWQRPTDEASRVVARGDDAAELVLGPIFPVLGGGLGGGAVTAAGRPAAPARVVGTVDLAGGVELGDATLLKLKVDAAATAEVDLAAAVDLDAVVAAINGAVGSAPASHDGRFLSLASPKTGAASRLKLFEPSDATRDAARALLGLVPRRARGTAATVATVRGAELPASLDLRAERFVRLGVDGELLAEIDLAGADPAATTPAELVAAINAGLGAEVASLDGAVLVLTSPSSGGASRLSFQSPAAQDARELLFGPLDATVVLGRDPAAARLVSRADLSAGVDLSRRSKIRLRIDAAAAQVIELAGAEPAQTTLEEIVGAINAALGTPAASIVDGALVVASAKLGPTSQVALLELPGEDAAELVFGVSPRLYEGSAAEPARITGVAEAPAAGFDLWARHVLRLAVDGKAAVDVDLRAGAAERGAVSLDELVARLEEAAGPGVASRDGDRLVLTSPAADGTGGLRVERRGGLERRRFVSRAAVRNEASTALFGFVEGAAEGRGAEPAHVVGEPDLSRGVDLRQAHRLRIAVDGGAAVEVDVAGTRPRTTTLDELVDRLTGELGPGVASHDGRRLRLVSPSAGAASSIAFAPPRAGDALEAVLAAEPGTVRGSAATRVVLTGTADLTAGLDLPAGAAVRLGVDELAPAELVLTAEAAHLTIDQLVTRLNAGLGRAAASHDGARLVLRSVATGSASRVELEVPAGVDVTTELFGFAAPRHYAGRDAGPAEARGTNAEPFELAAGAAIGLGVDGGALVEVVVGGLETAAAIAAAVDDALGLAVATVDAGRIVLTSPTVGLSSRLTLERRGGGDARALLFGDVPELTTGHDPRPAVLEGEVDLLAGADLSVHRKLRLAVDGSEPFELDVAVAVPAATQLDEVIAALNAAVPGLASATGDDRLRLTSPAAGPVSRLEVLARRHLEVVEYPPKPAAVTSAARHGGLVGVANRGAAEARAVIEVRAPHGAFGPALVHRGLGTKVRRPVVLEPGDVWRLEAAATGDAAILDLPRGRTEWFYVECLIDRFDAADFDAATFAGPPCRESGVFDASRFSAAGDADRAVFAAVGASFPEVEVTVRWSDHRPGAFELNLPAELAPRFGGRFNQAFFGSAGGELFEGVALEPPIDDAHLIERLAASALVEAAAAAVVPLGFEAAAAPFRRPRPLTGGAAGEPARLYVAAEGLEGFLEIRARQAGAWGNALAVSLRPAGPAAPGRFDLTVHFPGAAFENARLAVAGPPPPALAEELLQPGPIGVLQAKAGGVAGRVTRDGAEAPSAKAFQTQPQED